MRNALLVALVAALAVPSFACGDASTSSGLVRRGAPKQGDPAEHDPTELESGDEGGNPNADAPPPPPADPAGQTDNFGVTLSSTQPAADLGAEVELDVTIAQKNGFTGDADLSVTGLPAEATATFTPAKVTIGATPAAAKLKIRVGYAPIPSPVGGSTPIKVVATAGTSKAEANANFKVNPRMTLTIPMNIDALRQANVGTVYRNEWGTEFGTTPTPLRTQTDNPIVVRVFNGDSTGHIIHGANGFAHGSTAANIPPNSFEPSVAGDTNSPPRERNLSVANGDVNCNGYMHEGANGPSVSFRIQVRPAP